MTRSTIIGVLTLLLSAPARGQEVVVDPTNLVETILIAERTAREYATLLEQYETIVRMARGLGSLDRYRIPTIGITGHDVGRWPFAAPWLQGLNTGDPYGGLYEQTARVLARPGVVLANLPQAARRATENAYAAIELTDSVAVVGANQVALIRGYSQQLQEVMAAQQRDV